jgi:hypothetical protein
MLLFKKRELFRLIGWTVVDLVRSRAALEAEIWTLRQQINVLRRTAPKRLSFSVFDHLVFAGLYRLFPKICDARVSRQFGGNNRTHKQNTNDAHWDCHLNKCPLGCWIEPGATHKGPIKKLLPKENSARED